ncbi:MAG: hypothetical protein COA79_06070 [Planctomycetota bacterium]|nr:MAG: hypothetical protein COA79_06070 [Planctomycetota bacterium]
MKINKTKKNIFIAATGQNVGKTTNSVGLFSKLIKNNVNAGFIKPVGQRYVKVNKIKIDEDSYLVNKVFNLEFELKDMNPIAVPRGFTEDYIENPNPEKILKEIIESYQRIQDSSDFVVIEGTGHAGVGSVFDSSNPVVAKALQSKVVLVTNGGIGNSIDQLILNKSLFDQAGVEILGVIINKVLEEKYDKIKRVIEVGLKHKGLKLLGVVPYKKSLESPHMGQLSHILKGEFISGKENKTNPIQNIIVGAMSVSHLLTIIKKDTLIITPGDREDIILAALSHGLTNIEEQINNVAGIVITGNICPTPEVLKIIQHSQIPIIICKYDTFNCASLVHDSKVKIQSNDKQKIELSRTLFDEYVDYDYIMENA